MHKPGHSVNLHRRPLPYIYPNSYKHRAVQYLLAQHSTSKLLRIFDTIGKKQTKDSLLKSNPVTWKPALSKEIGRLAQGIRDVRGNED